MNAAELALLPRRRDAPRPATATCPGAASSRSRTVWLLWLQYFCLTYGWYFYITWLPTYLRRPAASNSQASAVLAGLPLFFGGLGFLFCG